MSDVRTQITREVLQAAQGGSPVAVATVIRASQEGLPGAGTKLLLRADRTRLGTLDGGALEEAVAVDAV